MRQLLASLNSQGVAPAAARSGATGARSRPPPENVFTTLSDLLAPETSVPVVSSAPDALLDALLAQLPAAALLPEPHSPPAAAAPSPSTPSSSEPATAEALAAMAPARKRAVLARVLHGPQLAQALVALTSALREGGLPTVSGALGVRVENGGYKQGACRFGRRGCGGGVCERR